MADLSKAETAAANNYAMLKQSLEAQTNTTIKQKLSNHT